MKTFLISYDLGGPEVQADYRNLSNHIKSTYSIWAKPLESVWIVKSDRSAGEVRADINPILDANDKLIVVEMAGNWATYNVSKEVTDWLKKNV